MMTTQFRSQSRSQSRSNTVARLTGLAALLFTTALAAPALVTPALADGHGSSEGGHPAGYYLGLGGGWNYPMDSSLENSAVDRDVQYDSGWAASISFGHAYESGFRVEMEGTYRDNDVDRISNQQDSGGDVLAMTGMLNGYYDINTGTRFTPYVGVGIGGGLIDFDNVTPVGTSSISDESVVLAYQGIAGVNVRLAENLSAFADYRFMNTALGEMKTAAGLDTDVEYGTHTALLGLKWHFNPPTRRAAPALPSAEPRMEKTQMVEPAPEPAAVEPEPEPMPEKTELPPAPQVYLVFFDWDKATLSPEATSILEGAAANARANGVSRIVATGHADRSGPATYNLALSKKRASAVQAKLMELGVGSDQIAVFAKGEAEPLVSTTDGVREPQNRRVEIMVE
ncbi:MAG: OmpA family protein [Magnetovibrionaceae bacterium]